ncbi:phage tail protein [Campylobacter hyointestinalis subsp. hyointestinalis]|uniref:Phage tail protein n=1 Tax=Campylobacter hyointestinalis subsp. hyointestinalis TaxID=91352 RepID=A0A0S4SQ46_CAMHY|nr:phage tail protein I [Campylobacter hyointestinalis]CUU87930.1 phage tail protein [Campylobacter hyointestinalis subsp. hyointestinalis]
MSHLLPNHKSKFDKLFDELFGTRLDNLDISVINTLANSCSKQILPILANSFDVDIEGLNEIAARELIKNAFAIHYYSGTLYSLKSALKAFFGSSEVAEWFEYGGKPYHFKVNLEASKTGIDENSLKRIDKIINDYKNVRSVLESINLKLTSHCKETNGIATISGENIEVLPFIHRNKEIKSKQNIGIGVMMIETINQNIKKVIL